jgi:diketogulonate reductase-like aldo/keto reductase
LQRTEHGMLTFTSLWNLAAVPSCTTYPERCVSLPTLTGTVLMPVVALGTWRGSYKECIGNDYACVRAKAKASVMSWVDVKGDHVDTANNYRTQLEVGEALAQKGVKREDIFITTKCPGPLGLTATIQCAEDNLQMLGLYGVNTTGYLDLLLIHYPNVIKPECYGPSSDPDIQKECAGTGQFQDPGTAARQETWKAMELLQKLGRVKSIGFSNCTTTQFDLARAALIGTARNAISTPLFVPFRLLQTTRRTSQRLSPSPRCRSLCTRCTPSTAPPTTGRNGTR